MAVTKNGFEYDIVYVLLYSKRGYSKAERRKFVASLLKWYTIYNERYQFVPSEIATVKGNQLEIPMDLNVFGQDAAKFISYVESVWNKAMDFSIRIIATPSSSPTYLVKVDRLIGERAFVNWKDRVMQLHNNDRAEVLPHEFGHVLGFRDRYFTIWSSSTCEYTEQLNLGDIMSDHTTGQVLPGHMATIKKHYWKQ